MGNNNGPYTKGRPNKYDPMSNKGNKPPHVAGEYRIKDSNNEYKYIGMSNDLNHRMKDHIKSGKINDEDRIFEWKPAKPGTSYEDLRKHEQSKIKAKHPYANKSVGGEGRVPKQMNYYEDFDYLMLDDCAEKKGCYVATCVYGSYDCPEVWTLRRFRDYTLDKTWYGRLFIKTYYATSPIAVKLFGRYKWFKNLFKAPLNNMVNKLKEEGYQDTPYSDKY